MNPISSLTEQFKRYLKWNKAHLVDVLSILVMAIIEQRTVNWTDTNSTF